MSRIFISHSSRDDHAALALREWLAEEGWGDDQDVYLDIHPDSGMLAGQRWLEALESAATRCEAVVFLISEHWLTSKWCADEMRLAQTLNKKIFSLLIDDTDIARLPGGLTAEWQVVRLHSPLLEAEVRRYRTEHPITNEPGTSNFSVDGLRRLKNGLVKSGIDARSFDLHEDPDGPFGWRMPYRGLEALQPEDAAVFFGRDADMVRGMDMLRGLALRQAPRMMVILGASGAGKSSFLRAGLYPRLLRDDSAWVPFPTLRVAEHGAFDGEEGLVSALVEVYERFGERRNRSDLVQAVSTTEGFLDLLRDLRARAARRVLAEDTDTPPMPLLAVDQGEELSAATSQPESLRLLELLRAAMDAGELLLVVTIRSDSYDGLQSIAPLQGVFQTTLSLPAIRPGEIAQIIRGPAQVLRDKVGPKAPVFSPEVVEVLQAELSGGTDALPLLAFTMQRLMRENAASSEIGPQQLAATGGVAEAISAAARSAMDDAGLPHNASERERRLAAVFIPRLVAVDSAAEPPRKRVAELSDFDEPQSRRIVDALIEKRLLVSKGRTSPTLEIAHETLLRHWPELRALLTHHRESLIQLEGLSRAARAWADADDDHRVEFLVHRGQRLESARALLARPEYAESMAGVSSDYIATCVSRQRSSRLKLGLAMAAVVGAIAVAAVMTAIFGQQVREQQAQVAESAAELVKSQASLHGLEALRMEDLGQYDRAMRVALAGWPEAQEASPILGHALSRSAVRSRLLARIGDDLEDIELARISSDGTQIVVATEAVVEVWSMDESGDWRPQDRLELGDSAYLEQVVISSGQVSVIHEDGETNALRVSYQSSGAWSVHEFPEDFESFHHGRDNEFVFRHSVLSPDGNTLVGGIDDRGEFWTLDDAGDWQRYVLEVTDVDVSALPQSIRDDLAAEPLNTEALEFWGARLNIAPGGDRVLVYESLYAAVAERQSAPQWRLTYLPIEGGLFGTAQAQWAQDGASFIVEHGDGLFLGVRTGPGQWGISEVAVASSGEGKQASQEASKWQASPALDRVLVLTKSGELWHYFRDDQRAWRALRQAEGVSGGRASFSPALDRVAIARSDRVIELWMHPDQSGQRSLSAHLWQQVRIVGPDAEVRHLEFTGSSDRLLALYRNGAVRLWSTTEDPGRLFEAGPSLPGRVIDAQLTPDAVAVQSAWVGEPVFNAGEDPVPNRLISARREGSADWVESEVLADDLPEPYNQIPFNIPRNRHASPQVRYAAAADRWLTIARHDHLVWSRSDSEGWMPAELALSEQCLMDLPTGFDLSSDGLWVAMGQREGPLCVWQQGESRPDWPAGTTPWEPEMLEEAGRYISLAWSPDGRTLAAVNEGAGVELWSRVETGTWTRQRLEGGWPGRGAAVRFNAAGDAILLHGEAEPVSWRKNGSTWSKVDIPEALPFLNDLIDLDDGQRFVSIRRDRSGFVAWIRDRNGAWLSHEVTMAGSVRLARLSEADRRLMTVDSANELRIWDLDWFLPRPGTTELPQRVCRERLPHNARTITAEDVEAVSSLVGRVGEDVCRRFMD